jgi:hypothetical protein
MIVKKRGMHYLLRNFGSGYQEIKFTRKRPDGTFSDGTIIEELILVVNDKLYHFQSVNPSNYNEEMIKLTQIMLELCQERLQNKKDSLNGKTD